MSLGGEGPTIAIKVIADTSEAQSSLDNLTSGAEQAGSQTADSMDEADTSVAAIGPAAQSASDQATSAVDQTTASVGMYAGSWNTVGLSVARGARSIVSGISGIMSAEQGIYDAQQRVNVANINLTLTTREYGAGSIQTAKALDQLNVAEQSVTLAQQQLTLRFVSFGLTVGPQMYEMIWKIIAATQGETLANKLASASFLQLALAATAAAVAIGVVYAIMSAGIAAVPGVAAAASTSSQINQAVGTSNIQNLNSAVSNSTTTNITQNNSFSNSPPATGSSLASQQLRSMTR